MRGGDNVGHGLCHGLINAALIRDVAQKIALREAAHVQDDFDRLAIAAEGQLAIVRTRNALEAEIDVRCCRSIDLQLARKGRLPLRQRREVEIGEVHVLLDLEGILAREKNARGMGLDHVHALGPDRIRSSIGQETRDLCFARRASSSAVRSDGVAPFRLGGACPTFLTSEGFEVESH